MDGQAREGEKAGGRSESMQVKEERIRRERRRNLREDVTVAASLCRGVGAVAAATWFESLAVASRPLQRHLAETNFSDSPEKFPQCLRERLSQL